ncbi:MAG: YjbF family lipoprotein [Paracoccaceae bacterium]
MTWARTVLMSSALVGILAACSSNGPSPVAGMMIDQIRGEGAQAPSKPSPKLTRAAVKATGAAMTRFRSDALEITSIAVAVRKNGSQITYAAPGQRRLVMLGGLIQSARGYGFDLEPIAVQTIDPVAYPRPPKLWGRSFKRTYALAGRGPEGAQTTFTCTPFIKGNHTVRILGKNIATQRINVSCESDDLAFVNVHFVDPSGGIWQSRQWTGQDLGHLEFDVLEPFQ